MERLISTDRPIAISYALLTNVVSVTNLGASDCDVVLTGDWIPIDTTIGTISLREYPDETKAGILHISELNADCPGHDEDTPEELSLLSGRKVLIKADYRQGMSKIIGNKNSGPKLFLKTNSDISTRRQLQATFKNTYPNRWLSSFIPDSGG